MKCNECNKKIELGTVVFQNGEAGVAVCSEKCKKKFESQFAQQDFAVPWHERTYQSVTFEAQGCKVVKTTVDMKADTPVVTLQINLPGGVSVDEIKDFSGQVVMLSIVKVDLVSTEAVPVH